LIGALATTLATSRFSDAEAARYIARLKQKIAKGLSLREY